MTETVNNDQNPPPETPKPGKRRFKEVAGWISVLRDSFSIVATLISLATLMILIRQNERTYQPEVMLSTEHPFFRVAYRDSLINCTDFQIRSATDTLAENLYLTPVNIGLGTARQLTFQWEIDFKSITDTVLLNGQPIPTFVGYEPSLDLLTFRNCVRQRSLNSDLEFLLPTNSNKAENKIGYPNTYLITWSNLLVRTVGNKSLSHDRRLELLKHFVSAYQNAYLSLSYADINGKTYKKRYRLLLAPYQIDLRQNTCLIGVSLRELRRGVPEEKEKLNLTVDLDWESFEMLTLEL